MKKIFFLTIMLGLFFNQAHSRINVITSTSDLAYYTNKVGGDLVNVSNIASPKSDIHFVDVRPSYMAKLARADVVFKVGMGLDKWMDKIIDGSRNSNLTIVDCSKLIEPMEVPMNKADARHGDIHQEGNPHYWLGPQNIEQILRVITEGLVLADPENELIYIANKNRFMAEVKSTINDLQYKIDKLQGIEIIYYHNSWPYFNKFTELRAVDFVEPFPGVPPSPSHIKQLIELIKKDNIKIIAMEPYFDKRVPEKIQNETGIAVVILYPSIGGRTKGESYRDWIEGNIDSILEKL